MRNSEHVMVNTGLMAMNCSSKGISLDQIVYSIEYVGRVVLSIKRFAKYSRVLIGKERL